MTKLNIGAGEDYYMCDEYICIDDLSDSPEYLKETIPKELINSGKYIIHDLNNGIPFPDNSIDEIWSSSFLGKGATLKDENISSMIVLEH